MFLVDKINPHSGPGHCVILPGRHADPEGFVDTTTELDGLRGPLRIYLSVAGLRQLAERLPDVGLVPRKDYEAAMEEAERAREEVIALRTDLERANAQLERISGLKREGFQVVRAKGPKPTTKQEA